MATITSVYPSFVRSRKALGRSDRTLEVYNLAIAQFDAFLCNTAGSNDVTNVTRHTIQDFMIDHMQLGGKAGKGRTTTTANKTFRALRAFFNWMSDEELIPINPFSKRLQAPPSQAQPRNGYSVPEVKSQLANLREYFYSDGREAYLAFRDYALFMTLYDTGLRASEIINMTVEGLDFDSQEFEIKGKGSRTYRRHLSPQTLAAIDRYLDYWESTHINPLSGRLWRGWNGSLFTKSGLYRVCVNRAAEVNIKKANVHRWRYTHAEVLDELGWNEELIMAEMGHSQRSVSRHYRQASIRRQAIKLHSERGPTTLL